MSTARTTELTVMVKAVRRYGHTRNGNPVWDFVTDAAVYRTMNDLSKAYALVGYEDAGAARLTLNARGRVIDWLWLDPDNAHRND